MGTADDHEGRLELGGFERFTRGINVALHILWFSCGCPPDMEPTGFTPQKAVNGSQFWYNMARPDPVFFVPTAPNHVWVGVSVQTRAVIFGGQNLMNDIDLCWDCEPVSCPVP